MNFYISDIHFGHKNVLKHDNRPFADVDEMDKEIIRRWNAKVTDEDDVYILGDFAYKSGKNMEWYLRQLKGRLHLIIGNHDGKLLADEKALSYFQSVNEMKAILENGVYIQLCHYPLTDWNKKHYGSYHIHGHIHNAKSEAFHFLKNQEKALNAGCMINNYEPVTLDELIENNRKHKEG